MIKHKLIYLVVLLPVSILWFSCSRISEPCFQPLNVYVSVGTYKAADTGSTGLDSVLPKAVLGYPNNNMRVYNGVKANKFPLMQLSPQQDSLKWFISTDSTYLGTDTITFFYNRNLTFLSRTCGYTYHYVIQGVKYTKYNIDSVVIKNGNIDGTANIEHVKIFY
ncbi:MAG: hypothetical protein JST82_05210 [Bacteroidetes bacterium]|nr:hypothetical protein [Bacteroidota bacterium]